MLYFNEYHKPKIRIYTKYKVHYILPGWVRLLWEGFASLPVEGKTLVERNINRIIGHRRCLDNRSGRPYNSPTTVRWAYDPSRTRYRGPDPRPLFGSGLDTTKKECGNPCIAVVKGGSL